MRFPHLLFNFLNVLFFFFLLFRNYVPFEKDGSFFWTSLNSLHHRMLCAKFVWNWLSCSGKEDLLNFVNLFRYFVIISSWERTGSFIWTNLNPLQPMMHCAKFGWNWLSGSREEDFYLLMYFCSPWKRIGPFIWTNSNLLHPRMHCSLFLWNWPSGSGEEDDNVKSLRQQQRRRRTTDTFWSEKLTWAFPQVS